MSTISNITTETLIRSWIKEVCRRTGEPSLTNRIKIEWSNRLKKTAGLAYFNEKIIKLSISLFKRASWTEKYWLVAHEVSHLICGNFHNKRWKETMIKAGAEPTIYHYIPTR
jgi:predicted SprT family Zn-dependent metalloprotease